MSAFWLIVIILMIYFFIIRPLTRNRQYGPRQGSYGPDQNYGPGYNPGGFGRGFGMFAGGLATGALLGYLFEQGRINAEQMDYLQTLDQQEMLNHLQDQGIVDHNELDDLTNRFSTGGDDAGNSDFGGYYDGGSGFDDSGDGGGDSGDGGGDSGGGDFGGGDGGNWV